MLLPDDILTRLQRLVVRARGVIVVSTCIIAPFSASAQIVVPDVKRWSEEQCIWLHRHALDACKKTDPPTRMLGHDGGGEFDGNKPWALRIRCILDGA